MEYLRPHEARERFKLSKQCLKALEDQGKITPGKTPGGQRRYIAEDIEKALAGNHPHYNYLVKTADETGIITHAGKVYQVKPGDMLTIPILDEGKE